MSTATAPQSSAPRLDAGQSLLRVLELIRGIKTVQDIDAARLQQVFGVPFAEASGRLGFGERVSAHWWSSFEFDPGAAAGPRFEFAFRPDPPDSYPVLSDTCAVDFDHFASQLQAMGFARETHRAEHGRVINELFQREGLAVTVQTRGEADNRPEKISHACVLMVLVN